MMLLQQFQSLKAVFRLQNLIHIVEQLGEDRPVQFDIVNDENLSLFHYQPLPSTVSLRQASRTIRPHPFRMRPSRSNPQ